MRSRLLLLLFCLTPASTAWGFSVGTLNLYHYASRLEERRTNLENELRVRGFPDIMGFQEAARWIGVEMPFDTFVRFTGFDGIHEVTNRFGVMKEGIALVSRFPAHRLWSTHLPDTRMLSRQAINVGLFSLPEGGRVIVVNVHLSPFPEGTWRRVEQVVFMLDHLRPYASLPVVIMGDMNDHYNSEALRVLRKAGFVDVRDGQGASFDPTTNPLISDSPHPPSRLDYILYQPARLKLIRTDWMCRENWVSDHYGLKAEFRLR